jgi:hypothetical protein
MGEVSLAILEPKIDERMRVGPAQAAMTLLGTLLRGGHGTLYYKWYSGIDGELDEASQGLSLPTTLSVGSHVLTLTAKDKPGDALADLEKVREAGMTGGPPEDGVEAPCVVHVFIAEMVEPLAGASLDRTGSTLSAVAPKQWCKLKDPNDVNSGYELNNDYHKVNKIRYRWRFEPSGLPAGRVSADLVPAKEDLEFLPHPTESDLTIVRYSGPLPEQLLVPLPDGSENVGGYTLTLRVEELVEDPNVVPPVGHETSLAVVLT